MTALVEVADLAKTYSGGFFGNPVVALQGISFAIQPGELMGLLGPNGAGKTTTVKVLSGLVRQSSGRALLAGHPAHETRARRILGYMPERSSPPDHLSGWDCLDREGRLFSMSRSERRAVRDRLVARLGLTAGILDRRVPTYSKGERARLGLALALVPDPKILLLDEPTDGLDPVGRREVRDLLVELKKEGRAILLNSHLLSEAELCCDKVAILARGKVVAAGRTDDLLAKGGREFVVRTVPSASEEDLAKIGTVAKSVTREGEHLRVELAAEGDVDRLVDLVRARGLSLRELLPKKSSLEEYFLEAIKTGEPIRAGDPSPASPGAPAPGGVT